MALNKDRIFKAADGYIRSNKIEKAIAEYEKWLKSNKKDWNTTRQVGDLYARIGRNDEAIRNYAIVADHYRRDGFNVRAIATHKMILRLDPQNEVAMRNLAELQLEQGLLMEAKSQYQALVESYSKSGKKRSATEVFKKLAEIDPSDLKVRYKFADFLDKQGKRDEAVAEYIGIADEFMNKGLVDEGIKILEKAAAAGPNVALQIKLAQASGLKGDHARAIQMLEKVQASNPDNLDLLGTLGEAYLGAGQTARAGETFKSLLQKEPNNPAHTMRLAEFHVALSQNDEALELLVPILDKHVADNDGDKAAAVLNKILHREPHHVKSLVKLAEVHTILKQETGRISAYSSLCEAYSKASDYERAVQVAEQLVEFDPENSQHQDRLTFLKSKLSAPAPAPVAPAPAAQPPAPAMSALSVDEDLTPIDGMHEALDLGEAVSGSFAETPKPTDSAPVDLGDVVELTGEDEEHVREKLTEAEVFVRYGLVDKAISQLVDVLDGFRFHVEARQKLIEIYKDQSMEREAAEQMFQLGQVFEKLGRMDEAVAVREEASVLSPGQAGHAVTADMPVEAEEEVELSFGEEEEEALDIEVDASMGAEEIDLGELSIEAEAVPELETLPTTSDEEVLFDEKAIEEEISLEVEEPAVATAPPAELNVDEDVEISFEEEAPVAPEPVAESDDEFVVEFEDDEDIDVEIETSIDEFEEVSTPAEESPAPEPEPEPEPIPDFVSEEPAVQPVQQAESLESMGLASEDELTLEQAALGEIDMSVVDSLDSELDDGAAEHTQPISDADTEGDLSVELEGLDEELESVSMEEDLLADFAAEVSSGPAATFESESEADPPLQADSLSTLDLEGSLEDSGGDEVISAALPGGEGDDFQIDIPAGESEAAESLPPSLLDELALEEPQPEPPPEPEPAAEPLRARTPEPDPEPELLESAPTEPFEPEPVYEPVPEPVYSGAFAGELEEVDEYIALGLYEDAKDTLRDLLSRAPEEESVIAKIEELGFSLDSLRGKPELEPAKMEAQEVSPPPSEDVAPVPDVAEPVEASSTMDAFDGLVSDTESTLPGPMQAENALGDLVSASASSASSPGGAEDNGSDGHFVDLASELSQEIFGTHSALEEEEDVVEPNPGITDPGLDELFREFRKGVEKQLGSEDYDTRYNLGIAYKEMGLLDEAIAEFQLAAKDELRALECCSMLGLCFMEKGMGEIAVKWFTKGLAIPGRRDEEYHGLRYDLAQAYEAISQNEQALELYTEIFRQNARFRDVKDKVRVLQAAQK